MYKKIFFLLLFWSFSVCLFAEKNYLFDINEINYKRNFHQGLEFYQDKSYRAAIKKFLVALRYDSSNPLIRYYLGASFYKAGYVEDALLQWETIIKLGKQDNYLVEKINQIYYSFGKQKSRDFIFKDYIFIESYPTEKKNASDYSMGFPTSVFVDDRDNIFAMDAEKKQLLEINGNGEITKKHISKFLLNTKNSLSQVVIPIVKKPFDFVFVNNRSYYITDFEENKIIAFVDNKMKWVVTNNQYHSLLGPQGIAVDKQQNIYVTDIGNAKVHIYNANGRHLQSFGKRGSKREELLLPTDIFYYKKKIFVCDKGNNRISVFDQYGNHLDVIGDNILNRPRALTFYDKDQIVIIDHREIYLYDLKKKQYKELFGNLNSVDKNLLRQPNHITSAAVDKQKNIYLANAATGKIDMLAPQENLYANLWVEIENVYINEYPKVSLELSVRNKKGVPIINLTKQNFIVEDNNEIKRNIVVEKLHKDKNVNAVVIADTHNLTPNQENTLNIIVEQFYNNLLQKDNLAVLALKTQKNKFDVEKISDFNKNKRTVLKKLSKLSTASKETFAETKNSYVDWAKVFSQAIQENLNHGKRKGIIFICFQPYQKRNFKHLPYQKLLHYAKNNHIPIHVLYAGNNISKERLHWIKNLALKTDGKFYTYTSSDVILKIYKSLRNNNGFLYQVNYLNKEKYDEEGIFKPIKAIINYKNSWGENRHHGYIAP